MRQHIAKMFYRFVARVCFEATENHLRVLDVLAVDRLHSEANHMKVKSCRSIVRFVIRRAVAGVAVTESLLKYCLQPKAPPHC